MKTAFPALLVMLLPILLLAACTTAMKPDKPDEKTTLVGTGTEIVGAAASPLNDLNIVHTRIPEILHAAKNAPYARPAERSCPALSREIQELDDVLGTDLDSKDPEADHGLLDFGTRSASHAAVGAVRSASEGLLPYRGWVRKLSGAERHSKQVAAAVAAGAIRRAYLKGIGEAMGCEAPAAPLAKKSDDSTPKS